MTVQTEALHQLVSWPCPVCRTEDPQPLFSAPRWPQTIFRSVEQVSIARCRRCGLRYQSPRLCDEGIAAAYEAASEAHRRTAEAPEGERLDSAYLQILRRLSRLVRRPGSLIDIGCGVGEFMRVAQAQGWQASGIEPSAWASQYGRERLGLPIFTGTLERFLDEEPDRRFAVVTMFDMLEHSLDPLADLQRAYQLLEDGGVLLITTVNAGGLVARKAGSRWWLIIPEHLTYFDVPALKRLARMAGFEWMGWRPFGRFTRLGPWRVKLPFDDQIIVLTRKPAPRAALPWWDRLCRTVNRFSRYSVPSTAFASPVTHAISAHSPLASFILRQPPFAAVIYGVPWLRDRLCGVGTTERMVEVPFVFRHVNVPIGGSILDFGCVESPLSLHLANVGYRVTGVDLRPYPFTHPNLRTIRADIRAAALPAGGFDAVISLSTLEHVGLNAYGGIESADADLEVMAVFRRALRPGGRLLLTVPYGRGHLSGSRIYDRARLSRLLDGFVIRDAAYYVKHGEEHWARATPEQAGEAVSTAATRAVVLIAADRA